jgi:glycosyltransferase involved in cell wall biosynthesis
VLLSSLVALLALPVVVVGSALARFGRRPDRPRLVWGPTPLINKKYWSAALRLNGYDSRTLMSGYHASINRREDYDTFLEDYSRLPGWIPGKLRRQATPYFVFLRSLWSFDIYHHPFSGGFLGSTPLWSIEAFLLHLAGKKVVIITYGSDLWRYSRIKDASVRHALLLSYPKAATKEIEIERRARCWVRSADVVIVGLMIDGIGRWSMLPVSPLAIDTGSWTPRTVRSGNDGRNGPVYVLHTPNHRGFKGTEFLVNAVAQLREEGLEVNLIMLERVPNDEVRRVMREEADILAEQFVCPGYALSALEGMASGLPVLSNLADEHYTRVFRRYSYLEECPILSTPVESIKDNLRTLVEDPELREALGRAGRDYVEKYHSYDAAHYLFDNVYRALDGEPIDLLNLYHPLNPESHRGRPRVVHPLTENRISSPGLGARSAEAGHDVPVPGWASGRVTHPQGKGVGHDRG